MVEFSCLKRVVVKDLMIVKDLTGLEAGFALVKLSEGPEGPQDCRFLQRPGNFRQLR